MHGRYPIRQVAYFVPDVRAAARAHAALFGSGPYYVADHIPLTLCRYRGQDAVLDHSSAYGQWGELMIEFVQQNNDGMSVFRELHPSGGPGFHHIALIVDSIAETERMFNDAGFDTALYAEVMPGAGFAMIDCIAAYGHFVELYEPTPPLLGIYGKVRDAARDFDGAELIRPMQF